MVQLLEARANPFGGMVAVPAALPANAEEFAGPAGTLSGRVAR